MHPSTTQSPSRRTRRTRVRTCVGCRKRDDANHVVRLVLGPEGQVAFDLAGHALGRGAHVHPTPPCLAKAARGGLARAFRTHVVCDTAMLQADLERAAERRIEGLLNAAFQSGNVVLGRQAVHTALERNELDRVLVAGDAWDAQQSVPQSVPQNVPQNAPGKQSLMEAIARGRAVAWGTKVKLGAALGRSSVAVVGIRSPLLGAAIANVCHIADGARSCSEVR